MQQIVKVFLKNNDYLITRANGTEKEIQEYYNKNQEVEKIRFIYKVGSTRQEQLERLNKPSIFRIKPVTEEEMDKKYLIKDIDLINKLELLRDKYNDRIPERETNHYGLTPRHIEWTFDGYARVTCEQMED